MHCAVDPVEIGIVDKYDQPDLPHQCNQRGALEIELDHAQFAPNQRLGYRNFSAFLNRYRIAEAREKLASREDVDLPVLTIAMDLGYNSLPTFNRAFRAETGTTPSEFRRQSFNGEAQDHAVQK